MSKKYLKSYDKDKLLIFFQREMPEVSAIVTYGSAWFKQAGINQTDDSKKIYDMIVLVDMPLEEWHRKAYEMNKTLFGINHRYTLTGKKTMVDGSFSPKFIFGDKSEFEKNFSSMYFKLGKHVEMKMLVVNRDYAIKQLNSWEHISIPARFQKETSIVKGQDDDELSEAIRQNHISATVCALFLCDEERIPLDKFNEVRCGLTYIGDIRMKTGAEDPHKISNIAAGSGDFFNSLYVDMPFMKIEDGYVINPFDFSLIKYLPRNLQEMIRINCNGSNSFSMAKAVIENYYMNRNKYDSRELAGRCFWTNGPVKSVSVVGSKVKKFVRATVHDVKSHF